MWDIRLAPFIHSFNHCAVKVGNFFYLYIFFKPNVPNICVHVALISPHVNVCGVAPGGRCRSYAVNDGSDLTKVGARCCGVVAGGYGDRYLYLSSGSSEFRKAEPQVVL